MKLPPKDVALGQLALMTMSTAKWRAFWSNTDEINNNITLIFIQIELLIHLVTDGLITSCLQTE